MLKQHVLATISAWHASALSSNLRRHLSRCICCMRLADDLSGSTWGAEKNGTGLDHGDERNRSSLREWCPSIPWTEAVSASEGILITDMLSNPSHACLVPTSYRTNPFTRQIADIMICVDLLLTCARRHVAVSLPRNNVSISAD